MENLKNVNVETKNEGLVVLSLFDGMSCGQIAFEQLGIKVKKYMASEIDKHAIKFTLQTFPNTIMLGDVQKIHYQKTTKKLYANCERKVVHTLKGEGKNEWSKEDIKSFRRRKLQVLPNGDVVKWSKKGRVLVHEGEIDILIGGSPCQGFSNAFGFSKKKEKSGLNHDSSVLFFEYLRLLHEIRPKKWFLENVHMSKSNEEIISTYLGRKGLHINSKLLTYQNRPRIYWTNIRGVKPPKDLKVNFQDYKLKTLPRVERWIRTNKFESNTKPLDLTPNEIDQIYEMNRWVHDELKQINPKATKKDVVEEVHRNLYVASVKKVPFRDKCWNDGVYDSKRIMCKNITNSDKIGTLCIKQDRNPNSGVIGFDDYYRLLSPIELAQAQKVPYVYMHNTPYTIQQELLGNGWTIDVIKLFFEKLKQIHKPITMNIMASLCTLEGGLFCIQEFGKG